MKEILLLNICLRFSPYKLQLIFSIFFLSPFGFMAPLTHQGQKWIENMSETEIFFKFQIFCLLKNTNMFYLRYFIIL